jgi:RNA ligase.
MYYKYPRTPHLPWSPGRTKDDRVLTDVSHLEGRPLVATVKMDGESTTLYRDHMHARSLDSKDHVSRHWLKAFHASIKNLIYPGWRICGENLYAKHSIGYDDLMSYFLGFSVWTENNTCLEWEETLMMFDELGIYVPEQFTPNPTTSLKEIDELFHEKYENKHEGYVVRVFDEFKYEDFGRSVAKYVRTNHVQTDTHWMYKEVIPNKLWKPTWTVQE